MRTSTHELNMIIHRISIRAVLFGAVLATAFPVSAQTRLPTRTAITAPTAMAGPTTLTASSFGSGVTLTWASVAGATEYRVTRVANTGESEQKIADGASSDFVWPNPPPVNPFFYTGDVLTCNPLESSPELRPCRFKDIDQKVKGWLYSYRVYAVFENGVVSPGSPVASVRIQ